jgi:hypothetical protein
VAGKSRSRSEIAPWLQNKRGVRGKFLRLPRRSGQGHALTFSI